MHVEFRISRIDNMCSFDAESFIRMHQLRHRPLLEASLRKSFVKLPENGKNSGKHFHPRVKIQFIFENLVCIESSDISGDIEHQQHERQIRTNWDASEIRTKRYRCYIGEAIVASLPLFVAERNVKVRLLQLAPELDKEETSAVKTFYPSYFELQDYSLCIGVAKISLRELLISNSGVSVTLQPKQSMIASVEALNLNTVVTNGMFGKDIGGSAVLTFQAVSIIFSTKSLPSLLCCNKIDAGSISTPLCPVGNGNNTHAVDRFSGTFCNSFLESDIDLQQQMSSPVVRFVLVPYIVLIDTLLRINDAVSWRQTSKTLLLLFIIWVVLIADMVDMGLILALVVEVVLALRMTILFYRVPPRIARTTDPVVSVTGRQDRFQAVLYSTHNHIINSMSRARLFFSQGLQSDCYFELTFIFQHVGKMKRMLLLCLTLLLFSFFAFSIETLTIFAFLIVFVVHPIWLRVSFSRLRKTWRRQLTSGTLWKALDLCRPMRVSRLVQIMVAQEERTTYFGSLLPIQRHTPSPTRSVMNASLPPIPHLSAIEEAKHHHVMSFTTTPDRIPTQGKQMEDTSSFPNLDSQGGKLLGGGDNSILVAGNSNPNNTMSTSGSSKVVPRKCSETVKYDTQQKSFLTFAVILITCENVMLNSSKGYNGSNGNSSGNGNSTIVQKLRRILQRARALNRSPDGVISREQYQSYFSSVLAFFQFLRRQCSLETYVTPLPGSPPPSSGAGTVRLDQLANLSWLIEKGEDDGITSTMLALSSQPAMLGKFPPLYRIEGSVRAFALLALYLLQGSRLSLYSGPSSRGCSIIIPLKMGSYDIEVAARQHPCPSALQKALIGFWKGWTEGEVPINNTDVVLKIIDTYKDSWGNESGGSSTGQDYHHMITAPLEENDSARDTSKRLLQTFSTPSFAYKRNRGNAASVGNPDPALVPSTQSPSDVDGPAPFFLRSLRSMGPQDNFPGTTDNYHRATQSCTFSTSSLRKQNQNFVSVPRLQRANTTTEEDLTQQPLKNATATYGNSSNRTESEISTPRTR
ncbi:uncharacterized protein TM35_000011040 [Trypanosoma theileri]|uniref:Transmembrane protein n=1 Tax=Trypanosoma theileri TaxID=67003 RepID=A0A1X0P8E7_9TRYP|nr:uncharacterized protein TM35_000011040 [Trypanosoma theileri]ORC93227.1 hypothetical protein TM35_000011040 [Trypanosoma theileri]